MNSAAGSEDGGQWDRRPPTVAVREERLLLGARSWLDRSPRRSRKSLRSGGFGGRTSHGFAIPTAVWQRRQRVFVRTAGAVVPPSAPSVASFEPTDHFSPCGEREGRCLLAPTFRARWRSISQLTQSSRSRSIRAPCVRSPARRPSPGADKLCECPARVHDGMSCRADTAAGLSRTSWTPFCQTRHRLVQRSGVRGSRVTPPNVSSAWSPNDLDGTERHPDRGSARTTSAARVALGP